MQSIWSWHNIISGLLNLNLVKVKAELDAQTHVKVEFQAKKKMQYCTEI